MLLTSIPGRMRLIQKCYSSARLYSTVSSLSGPLHFYQNRQLDLYASRNATPLTLRQLVSYIFIVRGK
jgi:hypothetical protein